MKILYADIETAPNVGHVWSLWNQTVSLSQLQESSYTLCVATMWDHEDESEFFRWTDPNFLDEVYMRLDEADALVTYNGDHFDIPTLNKDFLLAGYTPPAPFHSIDLYKAIKRKFRFPSNKLQYVAEVLGVGGKEKHSGHETWVKVMAGDPEAWAEMEKYCRKDTTILKPLYEVILPWIGAHPSVLLSDGLLSGCGRCGGATIQRRGYRDTATARYQRFQCQECGGWSQSVTREEGVKFRNV